MAVVSDTEGPASSVTSGDDIVFVETLYNGTVNAVKLELELLPAVGEVGPRQNRNPIREVAPLDERRACAQVYFLVRVGGRYKTKNAFFRHESWHQFLQYFSKGFSVTVYKITTICENVMFDFVTSRNIFIVR